MEKSHLEDIIAPMSKGCLSPVISDNFNQPIPEPIEKQIENKTMLLITKYRWNWDIGKPE